MTTRRGDLIAFILTLAGIGVAGYLTYVHYNQGALVCGIGNCEIVQSSTYAKMFGIPIALFGLAMYLAVLALLLVRRARPHLADTATMAIFAVLMAGAIYAAYLTYLEIWVIEAICQWCVVSAIITVLLLLVEGARLTEDYRRVTRDLEMEDS
ncbi:MAG TPA: vitamin K epoxide reductase family protein [Thermomicrobiales bacterium]|nr:vitamin K epoxide reductase family protein [Thermomicrobiales bacterium]